MLFPKADLTQEEIEQASRDLESMLTKLADNSADYGERANIVSILRALPEHDKARIPPLVRMLIEQPQVAMQATCTMTYPDGTAVEPHACL